MHPRHATKATALLSVVALAAGAPRLGAQDGRLPVDTAITTEHVVTIGGQQVPYRATVGTIPVFGDDGAPIASLLFTYYERSDVQDRTERPLTFSFNGGPGSGSLWMHLGYTGPKQLLIDDEGYPVQPYGVRDNPNSILDVTDIVFVNPVNVGFSRIVGDEPRTTFFGVNEDVAYLAGWIGTFVTRYDRWRSPKFLIGESYGTTRVSGLAGALQSDQWMYLNGVILVSPTALGVPREGPVGEALALPNFTATAWFHRQLDPALQQRDLEEILPEVERWTLDTYLPALARAGSLTDAGRQTVARDAARWTGVSAQWYLDHNLRPGVGEFRKELLRDQGLTVGRLDARYRGKDRQDAGEGYDYDPALSAWNHAFAPAVNDYLRNDLGFETDLQYYLFAARYTMWNLDPAGRLQDRMRWRGYRSGHMMYLRAEDIVTSNQDVRDFIAWSLQAVREGAARY
jgi:carboxypeptidase C (cathepsin A)